jgi:hypothetical protein
MQTNSYPLCSQGAGLFSVVLKIADGKKNVTVKMVRTFKGTADDTRHEGKTEMHDGAGILFDDEATARKFSKAMLYVIKHCGNK